MKIDWHELKYDFYNWKPRKVIREFYWSVKYGTKSLIKWLPIVWKDRDFDHDYFEDILRFKLRNMMNFFYGPDTHIENAEKYGKEIEEVLDLLERVHNDNYFWEISGISLDDESFEAFVEKLNNRTEEESKLVFENHKKAWEMEKEDRMRAYQLLGENVSKWWD